MKLMFVCEHNLVRSPVAEAVVADWLRAGGHHELDVCSAGVRAKEGEPVLREVLWAASSHHLSVRSHRTQRVDEELVDSCDLVVTMTEDQRGTVNMLAPQAFARTFTMRELLRLSATSDGPSLDVVTLAARAHANRPVQAPAAGPEDVADITGVTREAVQKVVDEVVVLSRDLTARLGATRA